jgi:hypothetical protein
VARERPLNVLFVRSGDEGALPASFRIGRRAERGSELPFGLLRLASAVKFASPHRVSVHDGRAAGSTRLRSAAAIHRPDVAVVWLHPALLAGGLEAARAVRHAGCPLVLGVGPLVDAWLDGARRIPELDGLLGSRAAAPLLAALEVIAARGSARALAQTLTSEATAHDLDWSLDRKLVDYASYTSSPEGWPPPQLPPPSTLLGIGTASDKGRFAASRVVMNAMAGALLTPEEVVGDIGDCDLLGIPWLELRPCAGSQKRDADRWARLIGPLRDRRAAARPVPSRLRLQMTPAAVRASSLADLRSLDILSLDIGDVSCADDQAVDDALAAVRATRRAGLESSATAMLGEPGGSLAAEERGLRSLAGSGTLLDAELRVTTGAVDANAWASWLEAPGPDFVPPGTETERLHLVERTRAERLRRLDSAPRAQALGRRFRSLFGTG